MNSIFVTQIKNGNLVLTDRMSNWLSNIDLMDVEVVIRKPRKDRSNNQNRAYWKLIIGTLSEELGYSSEEMHEILKAKFLREPVQLRTDKICLEAFRIKSSTEISTAQFEDYCSAIRIWSARDLGVIIPMPNEIDIN